MPDQVLSKLRAAKRAIEDEIRSSNARLSALEAKIAHLSQRLDDLETTNYFLDESITLLDKPEADTKRSPLPKGKGTRLAFTTLRKAGKPLSVPQLAFETLKEAGFPKPDDAELRATQNVLYTSLRAQVRAGRIIEHATSPKTYSVPANAVDPPEEEALDEPSEGIG